MEVYNEEDMEGERVTSFTDAAGHLTVFYDGSINASFTQLIVNQLQLFELPSGFTLVLNSPGGDVTQIKAFVHIGRQLGLMKIVSMGEASSSALAILLYAKSQGVAVEIDDFCHIVLHRCSQVGLTESRSERISKVNERWAVRVEKMFDELNKPLLKKLSAEEKREYKEGHNIYLFGADMIKLGLLDPLGGKIKKTSPKKKVGDEEPKEILVED